MTEPTEAADIVDHGVSDVLNEDEIVHVPEGVVDLAEQSEMHGAAFISDVPNWDAPDGDA